MDEALLRLRQVEQVDTERRVAHCRRLPTPHRVPQHPAAPGDRRAKTIHLTEAARPVLQNIEAEAAAVRAEILEGIPEEDLAMCMAVLDRVAQGLARTEGGA